jgi:hypothetical protein
MGPQRARQPVGKRVERGRGRGGVGTESNEIRRAHYRMRSSHRPATAAALGWGPIRTRTELVIPCFTRPRFAGLASVGRLKAPPNAVLVESPISPASFAHGAGTLHGRLRFVMHAKTLSRTRSSRVRSKGRTEGGRRLYRFCRRRSRAKGTGNGRHVNFQSALN